jgi:hypothetical protein
MSFGKYRHEKNFHPGTAEHVKATETGERMRQMGLAAGNGKPSTLEENKARSAEYLAELNARKAALKAIRNKSK